MLTLSYWFARGEGRMKELSICIVVLALNGLVAGCQKREPTRPAQPTVSGATERRQTPEAEPQRTARIARFEGSVRKRHFDLP
jgi:hypothetical protein